MKNNEMHKSESNMTFYNNLLNISNKPYTDT